MRSDFETGFWLDYVIDDRPAPIIIADHFNFPLDTALVDDEILYNVQDWVKGLCDVDDDAAFKLLLKWRGLTVEKLVDIPIRHYEAAFPTYVDIESLFLSLLYDLDYETDACEAAREYVLSALRQAEAFRWGGANQSTIRRIK